MDKSLISRLHLLGCRINYLQFYKFSSDYGYGEQEIEELSQRLNTDLNHAVDMVIGSTNLDKVAISNVDLEKLSNWEQEISNIIESVRSNENYQNLLFAYNSDNQQEIERHVRKVFELKIVGANKPLYHGVVPREISLGISGIDFENENPGVDNYINPEDYIDLVLKIKNTGIIPSMGFHSPMDENVRAIFTVRDPSETYGLLFFKMKPSTHGYTAFSIAHSEECFIYSKNLKIPMQLYLKSKKYIQKYGDGINTLQDSYGLLDYQSGLKKELERKNLEFFLIKP